MDRAGGKRRKFIVRSRYALDTARGIAVNMVLMDDVWVRLHR